MWQIAKNSSKPDERFRLQMRAYRRKILSMPSLGNFSLNQNVQYPAYGIVQFGHRVFALTIIGYNYIKLGTRLIKLRLRLS